MKVMIMVAMMANPCRLILLFDVDANYLFKDNNTYNTNISLLII